MLYEVSEVRKSTMFSGLNPYSNGICSMSYIAVSLVENEERLNPYSNGICSMS